MNPRSLMNPRMLLAFVAFTSLSLAEAQTPAPLPDAPSSAAHEPMPPSPTGPTVLFDTSLGRLTCQLFDKEAPETVANFVGLATGTKVWTDPATQHKMVGKPLYNGTQFHRVIPGFMIQGGDPLADGRGDTGFYLPDEISPALRFDVPGRLAMANSGPDTNSSQFFLTVAPTPQLNGHYTLFGQCDAGSVSVATSIAGVPRDYRDKPTTPVLLNKVTILPAGVPVPAAPPTPNTPTPNTPASNPTAPPPAAKPIPPQR